MRMMLLLAFAIASGCGEPRPPANPYENNIVLIGDTMMIKSESDWPMMFRNGHLVISVYPPVASKVKLEVEDADGKWSPISPDLPVAQETMVVVPYRVENISHRDAAKIDDSVLIACALLDWRETSAKQMKGLVKSIDYRKPQLYNGHQMRVVAPVTGHLSGVVQGRPFELGAGQSVAGAAAFFLVDIAELLDGDGEQNLAIGCFAKSLSTGDATEAYVDVPWDFVMPKK